MMNLMILNPEFPTDKTRAKALTRSQFDLIHNLVVQRLNDRKPLKDEELLKYLAEKGDPVVFDPVVCMHCKKSIKLDGKHWVEADAEPDAPLTQYCWVDPMHGSQAHKPQ